MDYFLGTQNQQLSNSNPNNTNNTPHTASGLGKSAASPASPAEDQYSPDVTPATGVTGTFGDAGSPTGRNTTISSSNSYFGFLSSPSGPRNPPPSMIHPVGEGDDFVAPPHDAE